MDFDGKTIETKLIHAGEPEPKIHGAVSIPVFQSSTFEFGGEGSYHEIRYIRMNNTPNHKALHEKLAAIENAEAGLVTSSGMSAISTALFALLSPGDHMLAQSCLYGGTHEFIAQDMAGLGIGCDFVDAEDPGSWKEKIGPKTRLFYVESITNPLVEVADLKAVVAFCRENNLISIIDNTFTSPVNFRPAEWGFDLSLHSCTKYLNGHSDIVGGAVIGKKDLVEKVTHKLNILGGTMDPHACFLLHRGLKTLALRVKQQNENALQLARFLESQPKVLRVNYPGLESNPGYHRAKELFDGFGGMLSFEVDGEVEAAERFIRNVTLPVCAPSLGGVESLITRPATTSHAGMTPEERETAGITDSLIRVSVGIESSRDLIADFENAMKAI